MQTILGGATHYVSSVTEQITLHVCNARESSTRVFTLYNFLVCFSLTVPKTRQRSFIELTKRKPTLSDFNRTR